MGGISLGSAILIRFLCVCTVAICWGNTPYFSGNWSRGSDMLILLLLMPCIKRTNSLPLNTPGLSMWNMKDIIRFCPLSVQPYFSAYEVNCIKKNCGDCHETTWDAFARLSETWCIILPKSLPGIYIIYLHKSLLTSFESPPKRIFPSFDTAEDIHPRRGSRIYQSWKCLFDIKGYKYFLPTNINEIY